MRIIAGTPDEVLRQMREADPLQVACLEFTVGLLPGPPRHWLRIMTNLGPIFRVEVEATYRGGWLRRRYDLRVSGTAGDVLRWFRAARIDF